MSYYRTVKGKKYDRQLLDLALESVSGKGDGRISLADAKKLIG
ncbi:MAG TPA: OmpA family protein, partial [Leptospiraceae bacterium]|nr:OmpA family protein [Leptospiraceae bacterium]